MKLSQWAKQNGINYKTAYAWFKANKMPVKCWQSESGSIFVDIDEKSREEKLLGEILDVVRGIEKKIQ